MQGFRHARWSDVDWVKGTIALRNKPNIGLPSKRVIPIAGLLLDILWEGFGRAEASLSDRILVTHDRFYYKQAFIRYRDKWCPGINLEPNGLRRTLFQESLLKKFYGVTLEMYLGHKPPQIPDVTWKHYLDRLRFEPDEVLKMFREDVVEPWDRVLEPFRRGWNTGGGNVVPLRA